MNQKVTRRIVVYGALGAAALGLVALRGSLGHRVLLGSAAMARGHVPTVDGAIAAYGKKSENTFRPLCKRVGVSYPPRRITLVAFKEEKVVEVWGANPRGAFRRLSVYPILAASGAAGPKRHEGDRQVPEGFYRISALNPASQFHLSLRVDYPNTEDIAHRTVRQTAMGGDIFIHGGAASIGCLALGDPAIEDLFCLITRASPSERRVIIAPQDIRTAGRIPESADPWVRNLYKRIQTTLRRDYSL